MLCLLPYALDILRCGEGKSTVLVVVSYPDPTDVRIIIMYDIAWVWVRDYFGVSPLITLMKDLVRVMKEKNRSAVYGRCWLHYEVNIYLFLRAIKRRHYTIAFSSLGYFRKSCESTWRTCINLYCVTLTYVRLRSGHMTQEKGLYVIESFGGNKFLCRIFACGSGKGLARGVVQRDDCILLPYAACNVEI